MNSYIQVLRQAAVLLPVLAVLVTVPYLTYNYRKYGSVLSLRVLIVYSFLLYLLCTVCLVILPFPTGEAAASLQGHQAQLVPFQFVRDILKTTRGAWSQPETWLSVLRTGAFLTTLFNLFMTMPFGMYLRYYFRCGWKKTLLLSFLLSLFFEVTQLTGLYFLFPGSYRLFDVDDLLVNTCGSMIGYGLARYATCFLPSREELDRASLVRGRQVSLLRRMLAFFYDLLAFGAAALLVFLLWARRSGGMSGWIWAAVWLAYFTLCPLLLRGRTLGHRLTGMQMVSAGGGRPRWFRYTLRYGLLFLLLSTLPSLLNTGIALLTERARLPLLAALVGYGAVNGGYLFFLLFEAVRAAVHKPLCYERWSDTRLESAIALAEQDTGAG